MQFLAKGKRGKVYLTERGTIIKKADDSRVRNEVCWLGILNKKGIGARLIEHGDGWFECEYIKGDVIEEYIKKADKKRITREKKKWGKNYIPESHPDNWTRYFKKAYRRYVKKYKPQKTADAVYRVFANQ